jgi:hypothetical protein
MGPSKGFGGGQAGFNPSQVGYDSADGSKGGGAEEAEAGFDVAAGESDAEGPTDSRSGQAAEDSTENQGGMASRSAEVTAGTLSPADATERTGTARTHFFVDVPNSEESSYSKNEQHVQIDPDLRAQLQAEDAEDISHFLALPEIIPVRKWKKQQPLLDYTRLRILTSQEYIAAMEHVLEQREATAAEAKRKKADKDATKEQRKIQKEEQEVQKRERAEVRAAAKAAREREKQEKAATRDLARQERLDTAAAKDQARQQKIDAAAARRRRAATIDLSEEEDAVRKGTAPVPAGWEDVVRRGAVPAPAGWKDAVRRGAAPAPAGWGDVVRGGAALAPAGWEGAGGCYAPLAAAAVNLVDGGPSAPMWPWQSDPQQLSPFPARQSLAPAMTPIGALSSQAPHYPPYMPHPHNLHFSNMIPAAELQAQQIYTPRPNPSLYSPFCPPPSYTSRNEPESFR